MKWFKMVCVLFIPASLWADRSLSFTDEGQLLTSVVPGQEVSIRVELSAGTPAIDLEMRLVNTNGWKDVGTLTRSFDAAASGTQTFTFQVAGDAPIASTYAWQGRVTKTDSSSANKPQNLWFNNFGSMIHVVEGTAEVNAIERFSFSPTVAAGSTLSVSTDYVAVDGNRTIACRLLDSAGNTVKNSEGNNVLVFAPVAMEEHSHVSVLPIPSEVVAGSDYFISVFMVTTGDWGDETAIYADPQSVTVTSGSSTVLPAGYQDWAQKKGLPASATANDDNDGDGASNIKEFFFGGDPIDDGDKPHNRDTVFDQVNGIFELSYRRLNPLPTNTIYTIMGKDRLGAGEWTIETPTHVDTADIPDDKDYLTVINEFDLSSSVNKFFRVRVTYSGVKEPSIYFTGPSGSSENYGSDESITFSFDVEGDVTDYTFTLMKQTGGTTSSLGTFGPLHTITLEPGTLGEGSHTVWISVVDGEGNETATAGKTITIESDIPVPGSDYLAPVDVLTFDGNVYVLGAKSTSNLVVRAQSGGAATTYSLKGVHAPTGMVAVDNKLYVADGVKDGQVLIYNLNKLNETPESVPVGHTPRSPVIDGGYLYVCNQFDNSVSSIQLIDTSNVKTLKLDRALYREPYALTVLNSKLYIANLLPAMAATEDSVYAAVAVVTVNGGNMTHERTISLPNGSDGVRGIASKGNKVYVTHVLAHHQVPTSQMERGWISNNALSIIKAGSSPVLSATVLLDDLNRGFANPSEIAFVNNDIVIASPSGNQLSLIHLADIDPSSGKLYELLDTYKIDPTSSKMELYDNLTAMYDIGRKRIELQGKGPRSIFVDGNKVYVGNYFDDSYEVVTVPLNWGVWSDFAMSRYVIGANGTSKERDGEQFFNDSTLFCFQEWLSCVTCHPGVRNDGMNWDLMNDGFGNTKNAKSLIGSHQVTPVMWSGVRSNQFAGVNAGFHHIQLNPQGSNVVNAVIAYLSSIQVVEGPTIDAGNYDDGQALFNKQCSGCHDGTGNYSSTKFASSLDKDARKRAGITNESHDDEIYAPRLTEVWRTAPYFHDGSATTLDDVFLRSGDAFHSVPTFTERQNLIKYLNSL